MISWLIQISLIILVCLCAEIKQSFPKHHGSISGYFENNKKQFTPQDEILVFLESPLTIDDDKYELLPTSPIAAIYSDVANTTSTQPCEASCDSELVNDENLDTVHAIIITCMYYSIVFVSFCFF